MSIVSYVRSEIQSMGVAEFSRLAIETGEDALQDGNRTELEQYVSIYTELLNYSGAPVNNLRHERRRVSERLTELHARDLNVVSWNGWVIQVSRTLESTLSTPLRDGRL